jgi:S-adenosylmethionine-diacylgycerolhomoserine-N-methlytransferase
MSLLTELRTLYHLTCTRARGHSHAERLESFYRGQADGYDAFRRRLLHGREEMMAGLDIRPGERLLDLGGGTGANLEFLGDRLALLESAHVVDLCPSLLEAARRRAARHGWANVHTVLADVTTYQPEHAPVDLVTFSYSLTMVPNWFQALERAHALLRPGGMIGVVDFYVARKWPAEGTRRQWGLTRWFWRTWFGMDNVFLSPDHLPWLQAHFETVRLEERRGRVPYLLGLKAPHYIFLGRKRSESI